MNGKKIVEIALSFVGQQEIAGNMGFEDKRFQELMEECGWQEGQAWCAYFCELVWKQALKDECDITVLDKLFAAGAVLTYNNFKKAGFCVNHKPEPGAIAIWQHWKNNEPHWTGHAGIVIDVLSSGEFKTVEGNTNSQGGREGIEVAEKIRKVTYDARNGLVLKGFIHI